VSSNNIQLFELNSKILSQTTKFIRESLNDFSVYINKHEIRCNKNLCCCLSDLIFQSVIHDQSLTEFYFNNAINKNIIIDLFQILSGYPFKPRNYNMKEVIESFLLILTLVEIDYILDDFESLISFLSSQNCSFYERIFQKALKILAFNFNQTTKEYLSILPFHAIESVILNKHLRIESETFLFNLFKQDERNFSLFQFLKFPILAMMN
jgi:hypothetical protein